MTPRLDLSRSLLRLLVIVVVGMATGCVGFHAPPGAGPADTAVMDPRFEAISSALVEALESHRLLAWSTIAVSTWTFASARIFVP